MRNQILLPVIVLLASCVLLSCSEEATTTPDTVTVSGIVQKAATGEFVSDAEIIALRHDNAEELGRTLTDDEGVFLIQGLPRVTMDIRVEADGFAPVYFEAMDPENSLQAMNNMAVQMDTVDSCCSGVMYLRVKNADGVPLQNVLVVVKKAGVVIDDPRTDEKGKVVVDGLCPGDYSIRIAVEGFKVYEASFTINANCAPVELTAQLQPESSGCCDGVLTVTVKDDVGDPVSGALVRVWKGGAKLHQTFTDSSGIAVFTNLCKGGYGVDISKNGYTEREFEFAINENCDPVSKVIVVEKLACCEGVFTLVVRDKNNNPVADAKVLVRKGSKVIEDPRTDANGRIVVDGLCEGAYNYHVSKDGYKVVEGEFAINSSCDPVTKEAMLEMEAEDCCDGVLTITAMNPQNQPISGALVKLWKNGSVLKTVTTDASGKAVFSDLCNGEYGVDITKDGWTDREFGFTINKNCDPVNKTFVLEELPCCDGVFTLIVRDGNGNPVQNAIVLVRKGSKVIEDPRTDANGRIVVDGLCKGEYNYRVSLEGYKVVEGEFSINENCDPVTKEVTLEVTSEVCCDGVFTLIVRDSSNSPIKSALVLIRKGEKIIEDPRTDQNGRIIVDGLCAGEYNFRVSKDGFNVIEGTFVINSNCDPVTMDVNLTTESICCSGVLKVIAVDSTSNPVEGATVRLWKNGVILETGTTNSNGRAVFDGLCAGSYGVDVEKTGFKGREFTFVINENCDPYAHTVELLP